LPRLQALLPWLDTSGRGLDAARVAPGPRPHLRQARAPATRLLCYHECGWNARIRRVPRRLTAVSNDSTSNAEHELDTDPIALISPGQGSQAPGMGRLVYQHSEAARRTFEEASDYTGMDIAAVCFEGNADDLAETTHTQPAVLTTSVAIVSAMREKLSEV